MHCQTCGVNFMPGGNASESSNKPEKPAQHCWNPHADQHVPMTQCNHCEGRIFPDFGCWAGIQEGSLVTAPQHADGTVDWDAWGEVTAPAPGFLKQINAAFKTRFLESDFSGR